MRRVSVVVLSVLLAESPVLGQSRDVILPGHSSGLADAIARAAGQVAAQQGQQSGKIPPAFLWTGIALLGAGVAYLVNGATMESRGSVCAAGVCVDNSTIKTVRIVSGGALAGVGGALLAVGFAKSHRTPSIVFLPGGLAVTQQVPLRRWGK